MSRILVLSNGVHVCAREALQGTKAVVVGCSVPPECAKLFASLIGIPLTSADESFSLSPQTVCYPATRKQVREHGVRLYRSLEGEWIKHSNWPLARGTCPALLTAYILALALDAKVIEYRLKRRGEVVGTNLTLVHQMSVREIRVSFRT